MFAFMGSIMAGIFANIVNFKQYQAMLVTANKAYESYTYNNYFQFGIIAMVVALVVVMIVANLAVGRKKTSYAWAASVNEFQNESGGKNMENAPAISWVSVILPVLLVIVLNVPIILAFLIASAYALLTCRKLKGGFTPVCRMLAKQFADGAVDVAPMIGFLLTLSMFNNAAVLAVPYFKTLLGGVIPTSALMLCVVFAVLTPLGFFRGPMNLVGCGAALLALVVSIADWPIQFLYPLFAVTTIAPEHLDITQSWVAWGFGYTKVRPRDYMKMSIPTGWIVGAILCISIYFLYGGLVH
jgi:NADH:ubiquinone oxidoreductase subunit 3 (subunit A)